MSASVRSERRSHIRVPARASVWYVISGALARGVGVLGTPIFTRALTPGEYGLYPLYSTWLSVLAVFGTLELTGSVIHRGLIRYSERREEFILSALALIFTVFGGFSVVYFLFSERISKLTGLSTEVFSMLLLQIIFGSVISLYTARCRFEYRYREVALYNVLSSVLSFLLSLFLLRATQLRAEARIVGTLAVSAALALPMLVSIARASGARINLGIWKYLLRFNLPLLPHYIASSVILRIGEISVGRIFGQAEIGKYSVAMSVGLSLTMITNGLSSALCPWFLRKIEGGKFEESSSFILSVTRLVTLAALLLLSVAPEALALITAPEYSDALFAVYPLALTVIPLFLSGIVMTGCMYYEKNGFSSLTSVLAAIISALLSFTVLPHVHFTVSGVFALVSYSSLALLSILSFKRLSGKSPISLPRLSLLFLSSLLFAAVLYLFRGAVLSRALFAAALLLPLGKNAREVYARIKER